MPEMSALLLTLLLAQPAVAASASASNPSGTVVVVSRRQGLSAIEAAALADRLSRALAEARVPVTLPPEEVLAKLRRKRPEACKGRVRCLAERGRTVGAAVMITLQAVRILDDLPIRLMAINTTTGQVLLERSETAPAEQPAQLDAILRTVAREIAPELGRVPGCELLPAPESPREAPVRPPSPKGPATAAKPAETPSPPADAPRMAEAPRLTPEDSTHEMVTPTLDLKVSDPVKPWRTVAFAGMATGAAAAVVLVGVAVGQTVYANRQTDKAFPDGVRGSPLTQAQAQGAIDQANLELKLAGGAAGFAALCGLWTLMMPAPAPAHP